MATDTERINQLLSLDIYSGISIILVVFSLCLMSNEAGTKTDAEIHFAG
jgi:hypothetical protein